MTTAQVLVAVVVVIGGQVTPQLIGRFGGKTLLSLNSWWIALLPPAWFAGFDDALAGRGSVGSWALAVFGLLATAAVLGTAFGKLAGDYATGLQNLNETVSRPARQRASRRWLDVIVNAPPLRWWLRDSVSRAAFLLSAAYLVRDREVKLRIYPSLAPMLVMPIIILLQDRGRGGGSGFGVAFAGGYLGLVPMLGLDLLQYSQQWQAADLFRIAPLPGPARLCHGARRAVLFLLALPTLLFFATIASIMRSGSSYLPLLLPGLIALPLYAMIPCLRGKAVPFSLPTEDAKSARRGLTMFGVMMISAALSGLAAWAWSGTWFKWLLLGETIAVIAVYIAMHASLAKLRWSPLD
jgi:hypothetical protein